MHWKAVPLVFSIALESICSVLVPKTNDSSQAPKNQTKLIPGLLRYPLLFGSQEQKEE